jgi:hypothetical protein
VAHLKKNEFFKWLIVALFSAMLVWQFYILIGICSGEQVYVKSCGWCSKALLHQIWKPVINLASHTNFHNLIKYMTIHAGFGFTGQVVLLVAMIMLHLISMVGILKNKNWGYITAVVTFFLNIASGHLVSYIPGCNWFINQHLIEWHFHAMTHTVVSVGQIVQGITLNISLVLFNGFLFWLLLSNNCQYLIKSNERLTKQLVILRRCLIVIFCAGTIAFVFSMSHGIGMKEPGTDSVGFMFYPSLIFCLMNIICLVGMLKHQKWGYGLAAYSLLCSPFLFIGFPLRLYHSGFVSSMFANGSATPNYLPFYHAWFLLKSGMAVGLTGINNAIVLALLAYFFRAQRSVFLNDTSRVN